MLLNPNKSDSEEEEEEEEEEEGKDINMPNAVEEEIEDWYGDIQRQKELKELELKNNKITIPQSSPKSQSISTSDMDEKVVHSPELTGNGEQKEDSSEDESEDSKNFNSEDTIANIV